MNKLLVSDIIDLSSGSYDLKVTKDNLKINVSGDVIIHFLNEDLKSLDIILNDNSSLFVYYFLKLKAINCQINIYQNNSSHLEFNISSLNNENNNLVINNYINGNNNTSNIRVRSISNKDLSKIVINAQISKNTTGNIALEDLKGINNGGLIHIEPNIVAESNEVVANHLTTIGSLNETELNYLMSKGIKKEEGKKLLLHSFIYSNMDDYIKTVGGE